MFGGVLRGLRRSLFGVWVIRIDGVEVMTTDTEDEATKEAARLEYVADGAGVTATREGGVLP